MQGLFSSMFLQQTVCLLSVVSMRVWGWLVGGGGVRGEQKITDYLLSVIKNAFIRRQLAFVYCFMNLGFD